MHMQTVSSLGVGGHRLPAALCPHALAPRRLRALRQPSLLGAGSGGLARGGWGAAHRTHPRQRLHTLIGVTSVNSPVQEQVVGQQSGADAPQLDGSRPERVRRLETLVELKKLYRNCIRAERLLAAASPVYTPPEQRSEAGSEASSSSSSNSSASTSEQHINAGTASTAVGPMADATGDDSDTEELERMRAAVEVVAEMQITAEQLRAGLRTLPPGYGAVYDAGAKAAEAEAGARSVASRFRDQLADRWMAEVPVLPFDSEAQAQAALDQRNSRYNRRLMPQPQEDAAASSSSGSPSIPTPIDRLNQAERVAEKFVERRIKPALQRAQERAFLEVLSDSGTYLRGLWTRLNGGGDQGAGAALPAGLALPTSSRKDVDKAIAELGAELSSLEKQLQEASKAREAKLRKAGLAARVQLASQLKIMDAEVVNLSRLLAVRTLQLEMLYVYRALEEEALDIAAEELRTSGGSAGATLSREGSTTELQLLVAEFALLDEQLEALGAALKSAALSLADDDVLEQLAVEVPDLRYRVGVSDDTVFGSNPFSLSRLNLQAQESVGKVFEGVNFLTRGLRLLGSDVGNATRLFMKAAIGGRLRAREVNVLRRTARDLLTFIPFIIILIIPITPLGHVLVFGFIQQYFPGFFPSQFTGKRQDIMMRYEELQKELSQAQSQALQEEEQQELARAAAAVARLTAPEPAAAPLQPAAAAAVAVAAAGESGGVALVGAAAKVKELEEAVQEARKGMHTANLEGSMEEEEVAGDTASGKGKRKQH